MAPFWKILRVECLNCTFQRRTMYKSSINEYDEYTFFPIVIGVGNVPIEMPFGIICRIGILIRSVDNALDVQNFVRNLCSVYRTNVVKLGVFGRRMHVRKARSSTETSGGNLCALLLANHANSLVCNIPGSLLMQLIFTFLRFTKTFVNSVLADNV